ncbi:MAG TPA: hypothetical protein VF057_12035, partial [Thermoanaerobaculia bacterium]
ATEHYRGGFYNRVMFAAPLLSSMTLATSATARERSSATTAHLLAVAGGMIGTGFHLFNVIKREGRLSWLNLFYGAPVAAPLGLTFAGLFGLAADHVRRSRPKPAFARALAAGAAIGLLGTAGEAALFHFRGAFHNKLMYLPVTIPPVAAIALANDALRGRASRSTRAMLRAAVATGLAGAIAHTLAVQREMGGWRNWTQNIHAAPPIPAPPSFTAMALAGLAALELMSNDRRKV